MKDHKNQIGIIGAGFISDYHIAGLKSVGSKIKSIYSRKLINAKEKALQYDISHYTADYSDILEMDEIKAVLILTPDFTHKKIAIDAINAGKSVFLQKPMAINSDQCREIIKASESSEVPVYVSFMHRYFDEVQQIKQLLSNQILGNVFSVRQRNATAGANWAPWFYDKDKVGGGVVMQLGVHGIDLLRYLFGEIQSVKAITKTMKTERILTDGTRIVPNNEDFAMINYQFSSGLIGNHEVVYNEIAGTDRYRMEIYGEEGTAWLRTEKGCLAIYAPKYMGHEGWFSFDYKDSDISFAQHKHFINMLTGECPDDGSAYDGLQSVLVSEAIYRSTEIDGWQKVDAK